jgi:hypothetical protein
MAGATRVYWFTDEGYRREGSLWVFAPFRVMVALAIGSAVIATIVWGSIYAVQRWSRSEVMASPEIAMIVAATTGGVIVPPCGHLWTIDEIVGLLK